MSIYLQNLLQGMRQEGRRGGYPTVDVAQAILASSAASRQDALTEERRKYDEWKKSFTERQAEFEKEQFETKTGQWEKAFGLQEKESAANIDYRNLMADLAQKKFDQAVKTGDIQTMLALYNTPGFKGPEIGEAIGEMAGFTYTGPGSIARQNAINTTSYGGRPGVPLRIAQAMAPLTTPSGGTTSAGMEGYQGATWRVNPNRKRAFGPLNTSGTLWG